MSVRRCIILILFSIIHSSLPGQQRSIAPDTVRNFSPETSSLALWATKKDVLEGECSTVTLAFLVRDDNQLRLRFDNLDKQFYRLYTTALQRPDAFLVNSNIVDIEGKDTVINNRDYTVYRIFEGAYCPHNSAPLRFPALKLNMAILEKDINKIQKIAEYRTTPLNIMSGPWGQLRLIRSIDTRWLAPLAFTNVCWMISYSSGSLLPTR